MTNIPMIDMLNYLQRERDRWMCESSNIRLCHPKYRRTSEEKLSIRLANADWNSQVIDAIIEKLDAEYYKKMKPSKEEVDRIRARLNALLAEKRECHAEADD
ncbi:MAG: hypothetical protein J5X22_11170 [Candidatus Accumulibacter sp.]|uniref:hypothetical protein n=1 Tax=Accumulibacter sp. TaxID=2053492 RepID=UPI001ACAE2D3|nr:hypothetical protein [Accumulibacter sp.]MBN8517775.1 hypothetical protein [Accumulibacter sp.]MBO3711049.1 hypothetical protein [Accumulibacter sp.]